MRIDVQGADDLERELAEVDARVNHRPMTPVLETLEGQMVAAFKANITSGGSRLASIAPLPRQHPATAAIRRYYGHGAKPRLQRGGQLLESIRGLGKTDRAVEVGTTLPGMFELHDGGELVDRRGRRRRVPPHPFLLSTVDDLEGYEQAIANYFFDEPFDA